jgi:hypothetical protein
MYRLKYIFKNYNFFMKNIEFIKTNKNLLAIILRSNFKFKGIKFFTQRNFSQQLGYMCHEKNHKINPHYHNFQSRIVKKTNEVLIIKKGLLRIDFFSNKKYLHSKLLFKGDVILLVSGGHGFEMLKKTEMIEVKQGPYTKKSDKKLIKLTKPINYKIK